MCKVQDEAEVLTILMQMFNFITLFNNSNKPVGIIQSNVTI